MEPCGRPSQRGSGHVIAEAEASPRRGKTLVTYDLQLKELGSSLGLGILFREEKAKAGRTGPCRP